MHRIHAAAICAAALISSIRAQTQVDLKSQSKIIDFTQASYTKPVRTGTSLPAICGLGELFFLTSAPAGSNLYACTSVNIWSLQSGGGGQSSGSGASFASQLADLKPILADSKDLTVGSGCSSATPCNVRIGNVTYSITASFTIQIASGSGIAYVYISPSGGITVGSVMSVTCSGACTSVNGITSFPAGSIPLFSWAATTSGLWDSGGYVDYRAFLSGANITSGPGLLAQTVGGQVTLSVDSSLISLRAATPASSSSACNAGAWATDGIYFYLCVNTNTWLRTVMSSW